MSSGKEDQSIWIEKGKVRLRIPAKHILYVKAEHVYCRLFFPNDQRVLKRISLERLLAKLPAEKFVRVHRSYAVNVDHILNFSSTRILLGDTEIPIGRKWRGEVLEKLRNLKS